MGWLFSSPEEKLEKALFDLKFASKTMLRESKKCEKEESAEKKKITAAIQKNNMEAARIHAENSIRQHNQALKLVFQQNLMKFQKILKPRKFFFYTIFVCLLESMPSHHAFKPLSKPSE